MTGPVSSDAERDAAARQSLDSATVRAATLQEWTAVGLPPQSWPGAAKPPAR